MLRETLDVVCENTYVVFVLIIVIIKNTMGIYISCFEHNTQIPIAGIT